MNQKLTSPMSIDGHKPESSPVHALLKRLGKAKNRKPTKGAFGKAKVNRPAPFPPTIPVSDTSTT